MPGFMDMPWHARSAVVALLVASATCGGEPAGTSPLGFRITLSATSLSLSEDPDIGVTLVNASDRDVYGPVSGTYICFERRSGNHWVDASDWFVLDGIGTSWALKPGEELSTRLPAGYIGGPGEYRFRYRLFLDAELTTPLHPADRISRSFVVTQ